MKGYNYYNALVWNYNEEDDFDICRNQGESDDRITLYEESFYSLDEEGKTSHLFNKLLLMILSFMVSYLFKILINFIIKK